MGNIYLGSKRIGRVKSDGRIFSDGNEYIGWIRPDGRIWDSSMNTIGWVESDGRILDAGLHHILWITRDGYIKTSGLDTIGRVDSSITDAIFGCASSAHMEMRDSNVDISHTHYGGHGVSTVLGVFIVLIIITAICDFGHHPSTSNNKTQNTDNYSIVEQDSGDFYSQDDYSLESGRYFIQMMDGTWSDCNSDSILNIDNDNGYVSFTLDGEQYDFSSEDKLLIGEGYDNDDLQWLSESIGTDEFINNEFCGWDVIMENSEVQWSFTIYREYPLVGDEMYWIYTNGDSLRRIYHFVKT